METRPNPFQFEGAHKLFSEERFLLADDMGMYKTSQAIFANNKFRERKRILPTLVVCPTAVREHWAREIMKWAYPHGQSINFLNPSILGDNISDARTSDWTIVHYPLVSKFDGGLVDKIQNVGFRHVILDEAHNAKNPEAIRTRVVKGVADQSDYLSLLSGTPIPNTIADLYTIMSLLDPDRYPFDPSRSDVSRQRFIQLYFEQPYIVKELFHRKMLTRRAEDYIGDQLPELNIHRLSIPLEGNHLEEYSRLAEQEMNVGKKIMELQKVSLDPSLTNEALQGNGQNLSVKYKVLDEIIEREVRERNGKVVVFSGLKKGVINHLRERYRDYGVVTITGDVDSTLGGIRERLRQQFQNDSNIRVLLATTTMNEGVDLTAATAVVNLTIPLTPAGYYQRFKRTYRNGEIKKERVDVYVPYVTIPGPRLSLEEATLQMLEGKERVVNYLMSGIQVSREELQELEEITKVPRIQRAIKPTNKEIFDYYVKWRGIGSRGAVRRLRRTPNTSSYVAELYPQFSIARNSSDIYIPIIRELEESQELEPKVDIACGPGMLGYFLQEPTVGIDISKDMLNIGRGLYDGNKLLLGDMANVPLPSEYAGLVVCSLAFQMTEPYEERAKTLQEMARVLKQNGYGIIILPPDYLDLYDQHRFEEILSDYGFTVRQYSRNMGLSRLETYVLQKTHECQEKIHSLRFRGDPKKG